MAKASDETKELAKELGIKSWHVKSQESLEAEITEIQSGGPSYEEVKEQVQEKKIEPIKEKVEPKPEPKPEPSTSDLMDLMKLMKSSNTK